MALKHKEGPGYPGSLEALGHQFKVLGPVLRVYRWELEGTTEIRTAQDTGGSLRLPSLEL